MPDPPIDQTDNESEAMPVVAPAAELLEAAHQQWHDAIDAYHDPATFKRHVETLIQSLRNVTFRIQASKADLPQPFDDWYGLWRSYLSADAKMRWLNDSRVEIVKRRGLSANSFALVTQIESYLAPSTVLLRLPAKMSTEDVLLRAAAKVPPQIRQHVAVQVARRWVAPELPGSSEIMAVLRHCYHVLEAMLQYAAMLRPGVPFPEVEDFVTTTQVPPCMLIDPSHVPIVVAADSGERMRFGVELVERDDDLVQKASRRYGKRAVPASILSHDPLERGEAFHHLARTLFKKDGRYIPTVQMRRPDGVWEQFHPLPKDKRDKFMIWHQFGALVARGRHDAIIASTEVWVAPPGTTPRPYPEVETMPGRSEALVTHVAACDGSSLVMTSPIFRVMGKPFLRAASKRSEEGETGFLLPIRRAWASLPAQES